MTPAQLRALAASLEGAHGSARALPDALHHERRVLAEQIATALRAVRQALTTAEEAAA